MVWSQRPDPPAPGQLSWVGSSRPSLHSNASDESVTSAIAHWKVILRRCNDQLGPDYDDANNLNPSAVVGISTRDGQALTLDLVPTVQRLLTLTTLATTPEANEDEFDFCPRIVVYLQTVIQELELEKVLDMRSKIAQHLRNVHDELEGFENIVCNTNSNDGYVVSSTIRTLADALELYHEVIKFLRRYQRYPSTQRYWNSKSGAGTTAARVIDSIQKRSLRVKDLPNLGSGPSITTSIGGLTLIEVGHDNESPSMVKCHYLPAPKIKNFFGRREQVKLLRETLNHEETSHPRVACVWGAGGIGKTQLALEYAYERKSSLDFIFWINSENLVEIDKSFSGIALELKLQGAEDGGNQSNNKMMVLRWLRDLDQDFLIIFDNVEDFDEIRQNSWPSTPHASFLATARHQILSLDMIEHCFEVPTFDRKESADLLLSLVNVQSPDAAERNAAERLSEDLGGLPLPVTVMGMNARSSSMSLQRFLGFYNKYTSKTHIKAAQKVSLRPYYPHSNHSAYTFSFQVLFDKNRYAYDVFRIACTVGPDEIPASLLLPDVENNVPLLGSHEAFGDEWELEDALDVLINLALVRRVTQDGSDLNLSFLYVHRTIQVEFRNTLSPDQMRENFICAGTLLYEAFPKLDNGLSFRRCWPECAKLSAHVAALCRLYDSERYLPNFQGEFHKIVQCLASCAWYLREIADFAECSSILETAFTMCDEKMSLLYADLLNVAGIIATRQNRIADGYRFHRECIQVRQALLDKDHEELANSYNNIGNTYCCDCRWDDAIEAFNEAIRIDKLQEEGLSKKILNIRYSNIAGCYISKGMFDKAKECLAASRELAIDEFGEETFYDADVDWILGHMDYVCGRWDQAEKRYGRAAKIVLDEDPSGMMATAMLYKIGSVAVAQGQIPLAITQLETALELANFNRHRKGDDGEIARVKRRLASALYLTEGRKQEAERLHMEAERIRRALQEKTVGSLADEEDSYDLMIATYYRGYHLITQSPGTHIKGSSYVGFSKLLAG